MLDKTVVAPPGFTIYRDEHGNRISIQVGLPISRLFDLLGNTCAGYDLFRKPALNAALKALLDSWNRFLGTKDSTRSLTDGENGWFSKEALQDLESANRGKFEETYVCPDPSAVSRGYSSWDSFFTREVQAGARPVEAPDDKSIIHNPCESTPYFIVYDVKCHDQFWLKNNIYSLYDMLNRDLKLAKEFVGGTVYQAVLSSLDYHRWRSPVSGIIENVVIVPGTYFCRLPDGGAPKDTPSQKAGDPWGSMRRSLPWLAAVATRALIYIRSDNADIGLICFIAVGMVEVSTCEVTIKEGQYVKAGSELGMFHYGGSTHVIIFQPHTRLTFAHYVVPGGHVKVNSILARVGKA